MICQELVRHLRPLEIPEPTSLQIAPGQQTHVEHALKSNNLLIPSSIMGKKRKELSHEEIWDDSGLLDAWNESYEEYKVNF